MVTIYSYISDTHFQCKTAQPGQQCIRLRYRCDFDPDCPDASDEMGCRKDALLFFCIYFLMFKTIFFNEYIESCINYNRERGIKTFIYLTKY